MHFLLLRQLPVFSGLPFLSGWSVLMSKSMLCRIPQQVLLCLTQGMQESLASFLSKGTTLHKCFSLKAEVEAAKIKMKECVEMPQLTLQITLYRLLLKMKCSRGRGSEFLKSQAQWSLITVNHTATLQLFLQAA